MNTTNVEFFIQDLSDEQKNLALSILRKWEREKAEETAESIILTDMEKAMANNKEVLNCVKSIKDRTECNLITAKIAMEYYIERRY